jgi:nifR3 family TIM-barrel protein
MISGFWKKLKKPILALAPMADVTDAAFRRVIAKRGKPDVFWTEFVSADGLCSRGKDKLLPDLWYSEPERPVVAQLFTSQPKNMEHAVKLISKLGFDGIDINMGCPDRSIEKQSAGAALMKNPELARKIILAAMKGAPKLPVSVKTRIGYNEELIDSWLPYLLKTKPAALTIHLRTRKEMSTVPARWELMPKILKLRDKYSAKTLILGNGDVKDVRGAKEKCKKYGCDGVMLGRGIFGNPWLFAKRKTKLTPKKKIKALLEHIKLFEKLFSGIKNFGVMKKHYKAYISGFEGAKELRVELMLTKNAKEAVNILKMYNFSKGR